VGGGADSSRHTGSVARAASRMLRTDIKRISDNPRLAVMLLLHVTGSGEAEGSQSLARMNGFHSPWPRGVSPGPGSLLLGCSPATALRMTGLDSEQPLTGLWEDTPGSSMLALADIFNDATVL